MFCNYVQLKPNVKYSIILFCKTYGERTAMPVNCVLEAQHAKQNGFYPRALCALPDGAKERNIAIHDGKIASIGGSTRRTARRFSRQTACCLAWRGGQPCALPYADGGRRYNADDFSTGSTCAICEERQRLSILPARRGKSGRKAFAAAGRKRTVRCFAITACIWRSPARLSRISRGWTNWRRGRKGAENLTRPMARINTP